MKTNSRQTEETLWKAFISGDAEAFELLVNCIYPSLFHYGSKFSLDEEVVKDCIQDVFLKIWESRQSLDASIPPMPYLFASLRRRIHRQVKHDTNQFHGAPSWDYFQVTFSAEDELIQSETNRELSSRFATLLNNLPVRQKEIVLLKFFENLSRDEIAMVMEISPQSVSNTLQKSLKWLRNNWSSVAFTTTLAVCEYLNKNI